MGLQTGAIPDSEGSPRWISESQHLSISGATAAAKQLARGLEGGGEEQDLYREKANPSVRESPLISFATITGS